MGANIGGGKQKWLKEETWDVYHNVVFWLMVGGKIKKKPAGGKNSLKGTQHLRQDPQQTSLPQTYLKSK